MTRPSHAVPTWPRPAVPRRASLPLPRRSRAVVPRPRTRPRRWTARRPAADPGRTAEAGAERPRPAAKDPRRGAARRPRSRHARIRRDAGARWRVTGPGRRTWGRPRSGARRPSPGAPCGERPGRCDDPRAARRRRARATPSRAVWSLQDEDGEEDAEAGGRAGFAWLRRLGIEQDGGDDPEAATRAARRPEAIRRTTMPGAGRRLVVPRPSGVPPPGPAWPRRPTRPPAAPNGRRPHGAVGKAPALPTAGRAAAPRATKPLARGGTSRAGRGATTPTSPTGRMRRITHVASGAVARRERRGSGAGARRRPRWPGCGGSAAPSRRSPAASDEEIARRATTPERPRCAGPAARGPAGPRSDRRGSPPGREGPLGRPARARLAAPIGRTAPRALAVRPERRRPERSLPGAGESRREPTAGESVFARMGTLLRPSGEDGPGRGRAVGRWLSAVTDRSPASGSSAAPEPLPRPVRSAARRAGGPRCPRRGVGASRRCGLCASSRWLWWR